MAAIAVLVSAGLGGCESASNLLSGDSSSAGPQTAVVQPPPPPAAAKPQNRITLAPVIGAPDGVAKQLSTQLAEAMEKQRVPVASNGEKSEYTVRGYIVAANEKAGTKVSYIWDVTDPAGKRVHRVTGEEVVSGTPNAKDPWSAVTPQLVRTITDRTSTQVAGFVSSQAPQAIAQSNPPPPAGAGVPVQTASTQPPEPASAAAARQQVAAAQPTRATGSIPAGELRAAMPTVTGAPGDGSQSLSIALQRELSKSGIAVSSTPGAYKIEGKVALGQGREGRQPIQIDWVVKDAQGNRVGTVSQKNEIEEGSLNGQWGQTAEMAAAAAAQGIVKLMQPAPKTSTN